MPFRVITGLPEAGPGRSSLVPMLRLVAAAAVIVPLLILILAGVVLWQEETRTTWVSNDRVAELAASNIARLLQTQTLVLDQAEALTRGLTETPADPVLIRLTDRLAEMRGRLPYVREICVVRADGGIILGTSDLPHRGTELTMLNAVRHFAVGDPGLFISQPVTVADHGRVIVIAVPRISDSGVNAGVVLSVVDLTKIEHVLESAATANPEFHLGMLALRRADGVLLARYPGAGPTPLSAESAVTLAQGAQSGRTSYLRYQGGAEYLTSWRRVSELNILILASVPSSAIVWAWADHLLPHLYFGIPATICLLVMTLFAIRRQRQNEDAARAMESERDQRAAIEEAHRQGQKMEALGKLTGGVAHDFNNLLAVILGSAELAKGRQPAECDRLLDTIIHAGQRASRLTRQLLSFSRTQAVAPRVMNLHAELPRLQEVLRSSMRGNIVLDMFVPPDVWPVEIDPDEWEIALLNVAVNARDAMPTGGRFSITVGNMVLRPGNVRDAPMLDGDFVAVRLQDSGPGMPPEVARRAFEPFFTTKEVGQGTGLGLSQVYGFASQAGGTAVIESNGPSGTRICLYLPRSTKPVATPGTPDSSRQPITPSPHRILVVGDRAEVAGTTSEMLRRLGYDVQTADRAQTALALLDEADPGFELLLTDGNLAGWRSGRDLAQDVRLRHPDLPMILMSDGSDPMGLDDGLPVLRKPFSLNDLATAIRAILDEDQRGAPQDVESG